MSESNEQTFSFELVSPERKLVSEDAWQVVIPGEEGEFGVRAGHVPLVAGAKAGVVKVWKSRDDKPVLIFVAGGFADVTAHSCTLLAEEAVWLDELVQADLETLLKDLEDRLADTDEETDKAMIHRKLSAAKAKLHAVMRT